MLGAITGDIIGSVYENLRTKRKDFTLFPKLATYTDDTVLTVAVADALLSGAAFGPTIRAYARRRPLRGYGPRFLKWMARPGAEPYYSLGNGSAMRVSPVAYAAETEAEVLGLAERTAACTHNHPEGIRGAQAVALALFLARGGASKGDIREAIESRFDYDLRRKLNDIRPGYRFDATCAGSVPEALIAFLESDDFVDAVRNAVSLGGDADTQAAIAGGIAEAHYGGVPLELARRAWKKLPRDYREVIGRFHARYPLPTDLARVEA